MEDLSESSSFDFEECESLDLSRDVCSENEEISTFIETASPQQVLKILDFASRNPQNLLRILTDQPIVFGCNSKSLDPNDRDLIQFASYLDYLKIKVSESNIFKLFGENEELYANNIFNLSSKMISKPPLANDSQRGHFFRIGKVNFVCDYEVYLMFYPRNRSYCVDNCCLSEDDIKKIRICISNSLNL
jgi:hypothetical protein